MSAAWRATVPRPTATALPTCTTNWFRRPGDVAANVSIPRRASSLTGRRGILELAVGTGRLAIPLAGLGHHVTGVDVSDEMLDRLAVADVDGAVTAVLGDMVDDLPPGPFDLVFVAFNSLFMLVDPVAGNAACFAAVARVLAPDGAFAVEAFVSVGSAVVAPTSTALDDCRPGRADRQRRPTR